MEVVLISIAVIIFVIGVIKSRGTSEDKKVARSLGMSLRNYKIYERIFDEQMRCLNKGVKIPDRLSEIPNMNEWRRYGDYMLKKQHGDMMSELDKLRNRNL